jgi:hypothetical protein
MLDAAAGLIVLAVMDHRQSGGGGLDFAGGCPGGFGGFG